MKIYAGIMTGGRGERFWPLSRERRPKQLLSLITGKTLLEETVERVKPLCGDRIFFITTQVLAEKIRAMYPDLPVLVEPQGRNTAPCALYAALWLIKRDQDALMALLPADHYIKNGQALRENLVFGAEFAREGNFVTFGIRPTRPETGYGYIEAGPPLAQKEAARAFKVRKFHEKPDREVAERYLKAGNFYWNSGMFLMRPSDLLEAMEKHAPDIWRVREKYDLLTDRGLSGFYSEVPSISIDYAVMEKAEKMVVIEATFDWEDVGSFSALENLLEKDEKGNVKKGDVIYLNSSSNVFFSEKGLVAAYNVKDLIVVHTEDVTLIIPKEDAQKVKEILREVRKIKGFEKYWK